MQVIFELNGWTKIESIDEESFHSGSVLRKMEAGDVNLYRSEQATLPITETIPVCRFTYYGRYRNGLRIFSAEG